MKEYEFKDLNGNVLIKGELPAGFKTEAFMEVKQYPNNQFVYVKATAEKEGCTIVYETGKGYSYSKQPLRNAFGIAQPQPQLGTQSDSGYYYALPVSIKEELDNYASAILNKKVEGKDYYNLSEKAEKKARELFDKEINDTIKELQIGISISPMQIANVFRNYLLDGGLGVYEDGKKILGVFMYRFGTEMDIVPGNGITENITGEPFGSAQITPGALTSSCSWGYPYAVYMLSDKKEDLEALISFAETVEVSEQLKRYAEQIRENVRNFQIQQAQMHTMQTQAAINAAWAQQQQAWAASDRLSRQLSNDMDEWRAGQAQLRAQSDARFTPSYTQGETTDDRIQHMRHESIMGVETYERNDGSTVEYSNYADRVFENNLDSTTHFGTHHYFDDYVPEGWHEMKKK